MLEDDKSTMERVRGKKEELTRYPKRCDARRWTRPTRPSLLAALSRLNHRLIRCTTTTPMEAESNRKNGHERVQNK